MAVKKKDLSEKVGKGKSITPQMVDTYRNQVKALSQLGCTTKEIGGVIGFSESSIERHLRDELDEGRGNLKASLRKAQVEAAIRDKNPTMLIWLGKCYLEQREPKKELEHSGGFTVEKVIFSSSAKAIEDKEK